MPMGASPAKAFGGRVSAGRRAEVNSSQRDDHSTSRRGGSGHWVTVSGMVSRSFITDASSASSLCYSQNIFKTHAGPAHSSNHDEASPGFPHPDRALRENAAGAPPKIAGTRRTTSWRHRAAGYRRDRPPQPVSGRALS